MQHLSHAVTVISKRLFLVTEFVIIQFLRNIKETTLHVLNAYFFK